jgi:raw score 8.31|nr:MAG TPA: hypothetical protein [Caudoviricetes sp.]
MFEKIKKHLFFIKDIIIDTVAYWATLGLVYVYTRFALVPEINADIQLAILLLISFVIYWVYKKTIPYTKNLHIQGQHSYLCGVCIFVFALGSFSQAELQQFGFNFSEVPQQAIKQYASLKAMFYAIGIVVLPSLLKPKIE